MKIITVISGGLDSTVMMANYIIHKHDVEAITFDYGSKHNDAEYERALRLCALYGVKLTRVKLDFMGNLFKSDLLKGQGEVPDGHYEHESMKSTVVPFRNGIMLSIAAGYAESREFDAVAIGNHFGDHAIYPDCRMDFVYPMGQAIKAGTYRNIKVLSPFVDRNKTDIVKLGRDLKVPMWATYSCYKGGETHCGRCATCVERIEAFRLAEIHDTTKYIDVSFFNEVMSETKNK